MSQDKHEEVKAVKRYNLIVPLALLQQVEELAQREHSTTLEVLRHFVKLGLYLFSLAHDPHKTLLVRKDGELDRELVLL